MAFSFGIPKQSAGTEAFGVDDIPITLPVEDPNKNGQVLPVTIPETVPGTLPPEMIPAPAPVVPVIPEAIPTQEPISEPSLGRFDTFNLLYSQYVVGKEDDVPTMQFAANSSIAQTAGHIIGEINMTDSPVVPDNDLTSPAIAEMDQLAATFAGTISKSVADLKNMKVMVDDITKRIIVMRDGSLAADPFMSARTGNTELATEFLQIPWNNVLVLGTESMIVDFVHQANEIKSSDTSLNLVDIVARKTLVTNQANGIKDIIFAPEKQTEISTVLTSALPKVSKKELDTILTILTNQGAAARWVRDVCSGAVQSTGFAFVAARFLTDIPAFSQVINAFNKNIITLSEQTRTDLAANIDKVQSVVNLMAYTVINTRYKLSAEALLLQNKMINPDTYVEYTSQGGTQLEIAHHLSINDFQDKLPTFGIPGKVILERVARYRKEISEESLNDQMRIQASTNFATRKAFEHVLDEYLKTYIRSNELQIGYENGSLIALHASDMVALNLTIEDAVWNCLIRVLCVHTFTEILWKALGVAYVKALAANESINETDKLVIDSGVYAELVVDFLLKKFTIISEPVAAPVSPVIVAPPVVETPVVVAPAVTDTPAPAIPVPAGEAIVT